MYRFSNVMNSAKFPSTEENRRGCINEDPVVRPVLGQHRRRGIVRISRHVAAWRSDIPHAVRSCGTAFWHRGLVVGRRHLATRVGDGQAGRLGCSGSHHVQWRALHNGAVLRV